MNDEPIPVSSKKLSLVHRLRQNATSEDCLNDPDPSLLIEAATEIERLRGAIENYFNTTGKWKPERDGYGWRYTLHAALSGEPRHAHETTARQDPSPLGCGLPWPTCETCTAWHDVVADPIGPGTRSGECRLEPKPVAVTSTYWCRNWQGPSTKRTPAAPPLKASDRRDPNGPSCATLECQGHAAAGEDFCQKCLNTENGDSQ